MIVVYNIYVCNSYLLKKGLCCNLGDPSSFSNVSSSLLELTPFDIFILCSLRLLKSISNCSVKQSMYFFRKSLCVIVDLLFSGKFMLMNCIQLLEKSCAAACACLSQNSTQELSVDVDSNAVAIITQSFYVFL